MIASQNGLAVWPGEAYGKHAADTVSGVCVVENGQPLHEAGSTTQDARWYQVEVPLSPRYLDPRVIAAAESGHHNFPVVEDAVTGQPEAGRFYGSELWFAAGHSALLPCRPADKQNVIKQ